MGPIGIPELMILGVVLLLLVTLYRIGKGKE